MKNLFFTLLALVIFSSCKKSSEQSNQEKEPEVATVYASYGDKIAANDAQSVAIIDALMADTDSLNVKLTGEIEKTCAMKGCWMTVKTGDSTSMRVTFKDYGFFVPKEGVAGKKAIMEGTVTKTVTSVEVLRHYAQDEGKSSEEINAITEPKEEYAFVATGVLIEESK